jgi:hypothetical protein
MRRFAVARNEQSVRLDVELGTGTNHLAQVETEHLERIVVKLEEVARQDEAVDGVPRKTGAAEPFEVGQCIEQPVMEIAAVKRIDDRDGAA